MNLRPSGYEIESRAKGSPSEAGLIHGLTPRGSFPRDLRSAIRGHLVASRGSALLAERLGVPVITVAYFSRFLDWMRCCTMGGSRFKSSLPRRGSRPCERNSGFYRLTSGHPDRRMQIASAMTMLIDGAVTLTSNWVHAHNSDDLIIFVGVFVGISSMYYKSVIFSMI